MAADKLRARAVQLMLGLLISTLSMVLTGGVVHAHKAVTSNYTYNDDVFPILRDKCGACHRDGGAAPMSLLTYNGDGGGAFAWAESMREMLTSQAMPPWYADPTGPAVKGGHALSARELDVLVTWASGGTPQGDMSHQLATIPSHIAWPLGKPDIELPIPEAQLPAGEMEKNVAVLLPTHFTDARWVKAADLLPGTPAMVRRATVVSRTARSCRSGNRRTSPLSRRVVPRFESRLAPNCRCGWITRSLGRKSRRPSRT